MLLQFGHQMHKNIELAIDRGENLKTIDKRVEDLQESAGQLAKTTGEIKRKMWWKNYKVSIEKV